jgi:hypothetical protein
VTEEPVTSRLDRDGTVNVWVAGWQVVFPADAEDPLVRRGEPPVGLAGENAEEVFVARIEDRIGVRCGDRMALVSAAGPQGA